jgi:tripeptide aminopeptidase
MIKVTDRFLKYVMIDTQSVDEMDTVPSSEKQKNLAKILVEELNEMGATNVRTDEHCYVYATIPATTQKKLPVIGFISHMDTATAISGKDVKPRIIHNYDGEDIPLNDQLKITIQKSQYPDISKYKGQDLIVTDGTTLLGADDKAGVAEIMVMAETLLTNPQIEHGTASLRKTRSVS